jgi:hypothetical protein
MALACGATNEVAATKAGVGVSTVYRRLREPDFQSRLSDRRYEIALRTADMMTASSQEAVKTLMRLMGTNNPPSVQLGAARALLEHGVKWRDSTWLEKRVRDLEQQNAPLPQG